MVRITLAPTSTIQDTTWDFHYILHWNTVELFYNKIIAQTYLPLVLTETKETYPFGFNGDQRNLSIWFYIGSPKKPYNWFYTGLTNNLGSFSETHQPTKRLKK